MLSHIPTGMAEIIAVFGSLGTPHFEQRYIEPFTLPYPLRYGETTVTRARGHYLANPHFQHALELVRDAGLAHEVAHYGGIYLARTVRGSATKPSAHAWGIAIDIEPVRYPLGSAKRLPDEVVALFARAGFSYGGDFSGRKDPMHFQLCRDY